MFKQIYDLGTNAQESKVLFDAFYTDCKEGGLYVYVARSIAKEIPGHYILVLVYDGNEIPQELDSLIEKHLSGLPLLTLPDTFWAMLTQRRREQQGSGKSSYENIGKPTRVDYTYPVLQDSTMHETITDIPEGTTIIRETPLQTNPSPPFRAYLQSGKKQEPFIIGLRRAVDACLKKDPLDLTVVVQRACIYALTVYRFTPSALALLDRVIDLSQTALPVPFEPVQIELVEPLIIYDMRIKAINIYQWNPEHIIEKWMEGQSGLMGGYDNLLTRNKQHYYRVEVYSEDGECVSLEEYDPISQTWKYTLLHNCPHTTCVRNAMGIILIPCEQCQRGTRLLASWARTALLIIQQEYSLTPDEPEWQTVEQEYTEEKIQRVGHGKNQRLIKKQSAKTCEYRLVTFDALHSVPSRAQDNERTPETRGSWLELHPGQIIYKKVHIVDVERTYKGEYFKHIISRCKEQGGSFEQEGRTYRLTYDSYNRPVVTSTINPHAKYIPVLINRPVVIKKVIAEEKSSGR